MSIAHTMRIAKPTIKSSLNHRIIILHKSQHANTLTFVLSQCQNFTWTDQCHFYKVDVYKMISKTMIKYFFCKITTKASIRNVKHAISKFGTANDIHM